MGDSLHAKALLCLSICKLRTIPISIWVFSLQKGNMEYADFSLTLFLQLSISRDFSRSVSGISYTFFENKLKDPVTDLL